jgi:hypothetical protein
MPTRRNPTPKPETTEEIADKVIQRFTSQHPELRQGTVVTEIPPTIRWAGIILGGTMTAAATAGLFWIVTSVNEMQVTLARMDERIGGWISMQETRYVDLERRISNLEKDKDGADKN